MTRPFAAVAVLLAAAPSVAQTCYRLPFSNPTLSDGWGSTCCGRTNPHRGVDFPQAAGTAIPAVADGVVRLTTYSGCLGNVVVVQHADGMFSGYSHLNAASPLSVGTPVARGQMVGRVGATGTCAFGAHLHLTMAPALGGYASGTTVDPYAFIVARTNCNTPPRGAFDAATCTGISGWAQDPNVASSPIAAHVYVGGPAGSPAARGFALRADLYRADLCTAIGSCAHGFSMPVPRSCFDGVERPVFAYAIDSAGGANTLLGQKSLRCEASALPAIPGGAVRRPVPSMAVLTAWKLGVEDIARLDDAALEAIPLGPALPSAPLLVKSADAPAVYVRDGDVLRHVANPAVMTAWKFSAFETHDLAGLVVGSDWLSAPYLVKGAGDTVYLLDRAALLEVAQPAVETVEAVGAGATVKAPAGGRETVGETVQGGCNAAPGSALLVLALGLCVRRRVSTAR